MDHETFNKLHDVLFARAGVTIEADWTEEDNHRVRTERAKLPGEFRVEYQWGALMESETNKKILERNGVDPRIGARIEFTGNDRRKRRKSTYDNTCMIKPGIYGNTYGLEMAPMTITVT